jgi:hypothetical protein
MRPIPDKRRLEMLLPRELLAVLDEVRGRVPRGAYLRLLLESEAQRVADYKAGRTWRVPDHMWIPERPWPECMICGKLTRDH